VITVLAGGVGAARFLRGLIEVVDAEDVTVIVNVGDDIQIYGLHVSPDLDSISYHLSGTVHPEQQWGRADESFVVAGELERFGHSRWFTLGDRDLATHVHRSHRLTEGLSLSQVTQEVSDAFGIAVRLLPVTDDPVQTRIRTTDGRDLHFQEYWVGERAAPEVASIELRGREHARPAPGVIEAIMDAETVLIAPSNPVVSIGTVLAVPGVAEALATTMAPVVGVSPIVAGGVVRGMADRLLPAIGVPVSALGVAAHYAPWLNGWVLDNEDAAHAAGVRELGLGCAVTDTIMNEPGVSATLARTALELADLLRG
jgi:LPPG:FO 2-phospho-L-lactate transferase